jgi:hypothetical protein
MARAKNPQDASRRMLSLWEPPIHAGAPVGVLATTFTLNTALFEEECLARFAQVQSDPARDGALYRIEREEKLASLLCAVVVADVHHCGGHRSLRWDLLASRPASGVMHAKISLLVWNDHVRVIVASANLTVEGYRRNQECASVLDFDRALTDRVLLDPLLGYLREILGTTQGVAKARALGLLDWVEANLPRGSNSTRGLQRRLVVVGPGRKSLFDQLDGHLPASRPVLADVVSPFFDEELRSAGPEARLWQMLRQRGDAALRLHVAGEHSPETNQWRLQVPEHVLASAPKSRSNAVLSLHPISVSNVPTDSGPERRPLHAKMLTLCHPQWVAWLVGSSNFTSAGTGLASNRRNYEANVLYFLLRDANEPDYRHLASGGLRGGAAVTTREQMDFAPAFDADGEELTGVPPLPAFFAEADLLYSTDTEHRLSLRFHGTLGSDAWWIRLDSTSVYERNDWFDCKPATVELLLPRNGSPPSQLQVEWQDADGTRHTADWPVNARTASALPPPEELRGLTLAALLELLSSARPLHEAMRQWLRRQTDDDDPDGVQGSELVDPHQKVDTRGFLIKRVQRACRATRQLGERLREPVLSEAALAWRLDGPVGARAVVEAIERQCDPALPDEWAFVLFELVRELETVKLRQSNGRSVEAALQQEMDTFVCRQRERLGAALACASESLQNYASTDAREAPHETA